MLDRLEELIARPASHVPISITTGTRGPVVIVVIAVVAARTSSSACLLLGPQVAPVRLVVRRLAVDCPLAALGSRHVTNVAVAVWAREVLSAGDKLLDVAVEASVRKVGEGQLTCAAHEGHVLIALLLVVVGAHRRGRGGGRPNPPTSRFVHLLTDIVVHGHHVFHRR